MDSTLLTMTLSRVEWVRNRVRACANLFHLEENMNKYLGRLGEEIAVDFLRKKGYKILDMNWKPVSITGVGELDIVARKREDIVFVEVKSMSENDTFYPEDHFNSSKAKKTLRAARMWLAENKSLDQPWQVDLITVTFSEGGAADVKHYEQAVLG